MVKVDWFVKYDLGDMLIYISTDDDKIVEKY